MSGKKRPPTQSNSEPPILPGGPKRLSGSQLTRAQRRNRWLVGAGTIGAHVAVFTALFWHYAQPPRPPEPAALEVSLIDTPKPTPPVPPEPEKIDSGATVIVPDPKPPTIHLTAQSQIQATVDDMSDVLSDAQVSGAASVGEGGDGGGPCDMGQLVQRALRRDPLVHNAVQNANRLGKAIMVWNGDWVRTGMEDGKGLSAVREAILWEVGFAPESCRTRPVHGMVLLSLADGRTRFAVGTGEWRWADLLHVPGIRASR
ncbi:MAG TPA: hypothetical protein VN723_07915 [Rhizomicrobium sp.]|nr:hypothetical protein [Rhizomicrobium sp.]